MEDYNYYNVKTGGVLSISKPISDLLKELEEAENNYYENYEEWILSSVTL